MKTIGKLISEAIKDGIEYWQCPCGYLYPMALFYAAKYDYGCPKCGTPMGDSRVEPIFKKEDNE